MLHKNHYSQAYLKDMDYQTKLANIQASTDLFNDEELQHAEECIDQFKL